MVYRKTYHDELWLLEDIKIDSNKINTKLSVCKLVYGFKRMLVGVVDPIVVDGDSKCLVSGYTTYLLLRFRGIERVRVILR